MREAAPMATVSIIVPVYNTEHYVERCINSLLTQTYHDIEIWAVDDGSTDGSFAVLERLEKQDARLHCLRVPHGGVSAARNAALAQITGAYLSFLDSDDWLESDTLECLVRDMEAHKADVVFFNSAWDLPTGARLRAEHPPVGEAGREEMMRLTLKDKGYFLSVTNKLFRVSSLTAPGKPLPRFDTSLFMLEDGLWLTNALLTFSKGYLNGRGFYRRSFRTESTTGNDVRWFENTICYIRSYVCIWNRLRASECVSAGKLAEASLVNTLQKAMQRDLAETRGERIETIWHTLDSETQNALIGHLLRSTIECTISKPYLLGAKLYRNYAQLLSGDSPSDNSVSPEKCKAIYQSVMKRIVHEVEASRGLDPMEAAESVLGLDGLYGINFLRGGVQYARERLLSTPAKPAPSTQHELSRRTARAVRKPLSRLYHIIKRTNKQ